jgi:Dyp-type peroxidase family
VAVARSARRAKGKFAGQAIAITTLTPVHKRGKLALRMAVVRSVPGMGLPLARLAFIFFGRWTIVDELPGEPKQKLHSPYLLFESNYDGSWADYLDAFADHIPTRLQKMWETCWGFDDVLRTRGRDGRPFLPAPFKRYVARNELEVLHFHSAYPDDTTRTVNQAIALADRLRRVGCDETAKRLALTPEPERRGLPARAAAFAGSWWPMVTQRYKVKPLTVVSPIVPGREDELRARLLKLGESPLARVPGTHFARFVLVPRELLALGQPRKDVLDCHYLMFTSNHDGSQAEYLRALARDAGSIWEACAGYPGDDPDAFAGWLGSHSIHTRYFVTGFPARTVEEVKAATDQRRKLAAELSGATAPAPSPGVSEQPFEPARTSPPMEARTTIAAGDVQGSVLKGYGIDFDTAWYGLLRVTDAEAARRVLTGWLEHVSFARDEPKLAGAHLNLAFTYDGLKAIGARDEWLAPLPGEFVEGAAERSADRADSGSETWQFGAPSAHVLAIVHARTREGCDRAADRLKADLSEALVLEHAQPAGLLDRDPERNEPDPGIHITCASKFSREHFGFADGCSQPSIEDDQRDDVGNGVLATRFARGLRARLETFGLAPQRYWRGVAPGEFLLGYLNEDGEAAPGSDSPLCPDATFMVYRKLEQDVQTFNEHTEGWAVEKGLDPDRVRAWIVGRWPDGTPLVKSPNGQNALLAYDRDRANDFGYGEDKTGAKCPFGAHVRRTNPRDDLPAGGEGTMRHRMIRRGMPYGPLYEDDPETTERGLMFICYGASISRGFETVQRAWCDTGFALGLGAQPDYLLQQRPARGEDPIGALPITGDLVLPPPPKPFVTVRGTEYLLMPGRTGLRVLLNNR